MDKLISIQSLSLMLLLLGVGLAFSQIRLSGWILGWILLCGALLLQGFRSLLSYVAQHGGVDAATYATANDWMGLGFSLLIVAAMPMMREVFGRQKMAAKSLQAIGANASDALIVLDKTGAISAWNPAAYRIFGFSEQEVLGKYFGELFVAERDRREFNGMLERAGRDGRESVGSPASEMAAMRKDGAEIAVECAVSGADIDDKWFSLCIVRDISARKRAEADMAALEAQLYEKQKMQAVGTLAGGIAHDFNNIIATIIGNAELARQDASENPAALESLAEIRKAGARAADLVQQILAFSRRVPAERKRQALQPVIEDVAVLLRGTLPPRLTLDVQGEAGLPPISIDAAKIRQAMINLVTNAVQSIGNGSGHIGIRLDSVVMDHALVSEQPALHALHAKHPGRTLRLTVSDDGKGIDAATLARVFEPFFTTRPVGSGTGLGLSVVHGIVQAHDGEIVAASTPGKGATFTVYLPIAAV